MKLKAKVGPKGQIVIPKPIRDRMGINPSDIVLIDVEGDKAVIEVLHRDPMEVIKEIAQRFGVKSSELIWGDRLYEEVLGGA
ncbi:MAG: AbrB/MazE/SpoVT family DNA-binding domain-containing protein [Candidatus Bathyarchaeia archaeon]